MQIKEIRIMKGPNYWSVLYEKLIVMELYSKKEEISFANFYSFAYINSCIF